MQMKKIVFAGGLQSMLEAALKQLKCDVRELIVFCFVGTLVAIVYVCIFYLMDLNLPLEPWLNSMLAFLVAVSLQYLLHTSFTFKQPLNDTKQIYRFLIAVGIGVLFSTLVTGLIWPLTKLPNIFAVMVVAVTLPVVNFLIFSLWVYANRKKNNEKSSI